MSNNTSIAFGAGVMIGTSASGQPVQFGTLQEASVDFSFSAKELTGQFQFPVAVARGKGKITGKAKFANIDGPVFNNLFFGASSTPGQKLWSYNEAAAVPSGSPYTVSCANAASYDADLGVIYAATGMQLLKVVSNPSQGQYSIASGVYTFNAADAGKALLLSYSYLQATMGARSIISNKLMGVAPSFQIDFYQSNPNIAGAQWSLRLYNCMSSKLIIGTKLEDFVIPEIDFSAFTNAANNVGELNTAI